VNILEIRLVVDLTFWFLFLFYKLFPHFFSLAYTEDSSDSPEQQISTTKWKSMEEQTFHATRASAHSIFNHEKSFTAAVSGVTTLAGKENGISNNVNNINIIDEEIVAQASNQPPSTSDNFYGVV